MEEKKMDQAYEEPRVEDLGSLAELTAHKVDSGSDWTYFLGDPS